MRIIRAPADRFTPPAPCLNCDTMMVPWWRFYGKVLFCPQCDPEEQYDEL